VLHLWHLVFRQLPNKNEVYAAKNGGGDPSRKAGQLFERLGPCRRVIVRGAAQRRSQMRRVLYILSRQYAPDVLPMKIDGVETKNAAPGRNDAGNFGRQSPRSLTLADNFFVAAHF